MAPTDTKQMNEKLDTVLKGIADIKLDVGDIKQKIGSVQTHLDIVEAAAGRCEYHYINLEAMAEKLNKLIFHAIEESKTDENCIELISNLVTEKLDGTWSI